MQTQAGSLGDPNTMSPPTRGLHPYTPSLKRTPSRWTLFSDTIVTVIKTKRIFRQISGTR
ncbi:MAG: hypothetical protein MIO93_00475 [ANME-2 cluster archaeon]|nr:hypothetical protein [ANME-2 cluster archaeon]